MNHRAAVTGMDRKLGALLQELEDLNMANSTAIIIHGDHGWSLSELGLWRKMSNYENAVCVHTIRLQTDLFTVYFTPGACSFDHEGAVASDTQTMQRACRTSRLGTNDMGTRGIGSTSRRRLRWCEPCASSVRCNSDGKGRRVFTVRATQANGPQECSPQYIVGTLAVSLTLRHRGVTTQ